MKRAMTPVGSRRSGRLAVGGALAACLTMTSLLVSGGGAVAGAANKTSISAAKKAVAALEKRPQSLPTNVRITKSIPKGKTIDWLQCTTPLCTMLAKPLKAAARALGWNVRTISDGLSPTTVKSAWGIAVTDHPDAVFSGGFPSSIFSSELSQLASQNIPFIDSYVATTLSPGITAIIQGKNTNFKIGKAFADWVVAAKGKKADTLIVTSTTFSNLNQVVSSFKKRYSKLCGSCKLTVLNEPATTFGSKLPNDVVGYLQAHPNINYLVPDEGSMLIGLPQALTTAGIQIPVVGQYPSPTTVEYLQQGTYVKALLMPQVVDSMWQMVTAAARKFTGMSVKPADAPSPLWFVTPKTASKLSYPYYLIPNYQQKYKKLWGVKKK